MSANPASAPVRAYDPTSPLAKLLRQCRRAFAFVFIVTLVTEILSLAPILFMLNVFDRVLSSRSQVTLVSLTALVIGVYILWSALEWVRSRLLVRISLRIDWDLAARVFDASFRRYIGRKKVNVQQVLGDLLQLRQFLTASSLLAVMSAPFAVVFIIVGGLFHPYLAVFSLVASVVLLVTSYLTQKASTPALRAANEAQAESNRLAGENLRLAETAHALGMQSEIRNRWYRRHQDYLQLQVNASEAAGVMGGVSGFLAKSLPSLQMALACYLAIEGLITGGMVVAASLLISKAIGPMQKLLGSWKEISNSRQAYERLDQLLVEDEGQADRMALPPPKGKLIVASLAAIPPGGKKAVLQGINFTAGPGQITTVIGQSAAGKTTLMRLLVGVWRPAGGSVRLDGAEICDWAHDEVGRYIGYVPQEIDFFEGTIAENIARLGPVDSAKVVQATKLAGMHEIILALPQGYETQLGPTGHGLTGGQRQRLAIARAFYGEPPYIVMDEPNANLDEVSERALIAALKELKARGANVILTTHRPSLMEVADQVLVLIEGRQGGFGPAAEMIAAARKANAGADLQSSAPAAALLKATPGAAPVAASAPTPRTAAMPPQPAAGAPAAATPVTSPATAVRSLETPPASASAGSTTGTPASSSSVSTGVVGATPASARVPAPASAPGSVPTVAPSSSQPSASTGGNVAAPMPASAPTTPASATAAQAARPAASAPPQGAASAGNAASGAPQPNAPASDASAQPRPPVNGTLRQLRLEALDLQTPGQLENSVDNVGACCFDAKSYAIQLKFQLVSLFRNGVIAGFCLVDEATKKSVMLNPKRAESPAVAASHADISWSRASRFVFDEVVGLGATPQRLALIVVPSFDEAWYLQTYIDVAEAIKNGAFKSGREHYLRHGHLENREAGPNAGKPQKLALLHAVPAEGATAGAQAH